MSIIINYKSLQEFDGKETAMIQTLEMESGMITSGTDDEKPIILNTTLYYYIFMLDPKAQFFSDSPQILPQTMLSLKANHLFVFIKVVSNSKQLFMGTVCLQYLSLIFTYLRP